MRRMGQPIEIGIAIGIVAPGEGRNEGRVTEARGKALDEAESQDRKTELDRIAAMLSRLGGRGCQVREGTVTYGSVRARSRSRPDLDEGKT